MDKLLQLCLNISFHCQDFISVSCHKKVELSHQDDVLSIAAYFNIPVKKHGGKKNLINKIRIFYNNPCRIDWARNYLAKSYIQRTLK